MLFFPRIEIEARRESLDEVPGGMERASCCCWNFPPDSDGILADFRSISPHSGGILLHLFFNFHHFTSFLNDLQSPYFPDKMHFLQLIVLQWHHYSKYLTTSNSETDKIEHFIKSSILRNLLSLNELLEIHLTECMKFFQRYFLRKLWSHNELQNQTLDKCQ